MALLPKVLKNGDVRAFSIDFAYICMPQFLISVHVGCFFDGFIYSTSSESVQKTAILVDFLSILDSSVYRTSEYRDLILAF